MSSFHSLSVKHISSLTPNSVAVTFEIPDSLKETFKFTAGQYITIKKEIDGRELRRAYSISSSPKSPDITIGIKRVDQGGFSSYANTKLKQGDTLEVMPPEGRFIFDSDKKETVMAFAAGSGITPIMSIARTVMERHPENCFVLVYGNQSVTETMFYKEILELKEKYTSRFFVDFVYSRSHEDDCLYGRIDTSVINYALRNKYKEFNFDAYYLCGPQSMIELVSDNLKDKGVKEEHIHYELFTTSNTSEIVEGTIDDGKTKVEVVLDDEEFSVVMDRKELVLDALLKANIDAPYSCQGGVCSTCIARIIEGKAVMEQNQILTDSEIEEGFVLTCQAHPTSAVLKIDYDDV